MNALEPRDVDVPGVVAILVLGLGLLDLFLDVLPWVPFYVVFVVGFAVVLPLVGMLFDGEDEPVSASDPEPDTDPLAELRRRYAEGEIDDLEFERRLERLLETEDEAAASEYAERLRTDRDGERARDADLDRESG